MTALLLAPGILALLVELTVRGDYDLLLIASGLTLATGAVAALALHRAPRWALALVLIWAGTTLSTWMAFQLIVLGLPVSSFLALSTALAVAAVVPTIAAWRIGRNLD